ncbi:MAG TPA: porin family protein [Gammaproteobacteria bacterium]|nr:porin family protein [Gammaproteobacteria bacterium]
MKLQRTSIALAVLGALALNAAPAAAQESGRDKNELQIHAGQLFGDKITNVDLSGRRPELDDDVTYGVRYGYKFTPKWGLELSLEQSPNSVTNLAGGDVDLDLTTFDVDAAWRFANTEHWAPYVAFGVGYASADLDRPLTGLVNGQTVSIDDDKGYSVNAGIGAKYFPSRHVLVDLEARYRYLDKVLERFDDSVGTVETSVGVGWRF